MARLPATVAFEGEEVSLYTWEQLDQQSKIKIKNLAMNLRDSLGAERLPPLATGGPIEATVCRRPAPRRRGRRRGGSERSQLPIGTRVLLILHARRG